MNDADLLRSYVVDRSESAFTALVHRHIGLVYATALRRLNLDAHLAEDVTQTVFTALARKAGSLRGRSSLAGWLYASTRLATAAVVRREQRRKHRELAAHTMQLDPSPDTPDADCSGLRPLLDGAIDSLKTDEREAVVLRFFQQRSFAEVGSALRVTEDAARKRVDRALDKLQTLLARRAITSTTAALGATLSNVGSSAVPAGLAANIAGAALADVAAVGACSISTGIVAALWPAAAVLTAGALVLLPLHRANQATAAEITRLSLQTETLSTLHAENQRLARNIAAAHELDRAAAQLGSLRDTLASPPPPPPRITARNAVTITTEGTLRWEGDPVTLDEFLVRLSALHRSATNGESKLIIHANGVLYPQMSYVLDEARKAGVRHIVVESDVTPDPDWPLSWF